MELARCVRTISKITTSVLSVKRGGIKGNTSMRMAVNLLEIRTGYLPRVQNTLCTILLFNTLLLWHQQLTAFCYFDSKGCAIINAPTSHMRLHEALKRNEIQPIFGHRTKYRSRTPACRPSALPALRPMPLLEEEVSQSKMGTRKTIGLTISFRKYNKNSLERRAGADRSSRKKTPYTTQLHIH